MRGPVPNPLVKASSNEIPQKKGIKTNNLNKGNNKTFNQVKGKTHNKSRKETKEIPKDNEFITIRLKQDSCTIPLKFEDGTQIECLVDSGATDSIISQQLINKSEYLRSLTPKIHPIHRKYITGNSAELLTNRSIQLEFTVQGQQLQATAFILPTCGSFSMVYGFSSLKEAAGTIDFQKCLMKLKKTRIPMRPMGYTKIQPKQTAIVKLHGPIPRNLKNSVMSMTLAKRATHHGPKQCLVQIKGKTVLICLNNAGNKPLVLNPKWIIGRLNIKSLLEIPERMNNALVDIHLPDTDTTPLNSNSNNSINTMTESNTYTDSNSHISGQNHNIPEKREGGAWETQIRHLAAPPTQTKNDKRQIDDRHISKSRKEMRQQRLNDLPVLEEDNTDLYLTDEEILDRDIDLTDSLLDDEHRQKVMDIIHEHKAAFSLFGEVGHCDKSNVSITLTNEDGFFIRPFRYSEDDKNIIRNEINKMVKQGILVRAPATHVSPVLLVKKKQQDGTLRYRIVIDFRTLNQRLIKPINAQNLIQDAINKIGETGSNYITLIDLREAYHALLLNEESRKYTGVIPFFGSPSFKFNRLPMGLSISGAEFTNEILNILNHIPNHEDYVINILDDILLLSQTQSQHARHIETIVKLFKDFGLKISPKKTKIAHKQFSYMGYLITFDNNGRPVMKIEKSKVEAVQKLPRPTTPKRVRSFIGLIQYLARFLPKLNISLIPLYELTKKGTTFKWTDEHQKIFEDLKDLVTKAPAITLPTRNGVYLLEVDTSRIGTGSILKQIQDGEEKIIAYNSKKLPSAALSYSVSELEMSGMLLHLRCFKALLGNRHLYV